MHSEFRLIRANKRKLCVLPLWKKSWAKSKIFIQVEAREQVVRQGEGWSGGLVGSGNPRKAYTWNKEYNYTCNGANRYLPQNIYSRLVDSKCAYINVTQYNWVKTGPSICHRHDNSFCITWRQDPCCLTWSVSSRRLYLGHLQTWCLVFSVTVNLRFYQTGICRIMEKNKNSFVQPKSWFAASFFSDFVSHEKETKYNSFGILWIFHGHIPATYLDAYLHIWAFCIFAFLGIGHLHDHTLSISSWFSDSTKSTKKR